MSLLWDLAALKILFGDRKKCEDEKRDVNKRSVNNENNVDKGIHKIIFATSYGITAIVTLYILYIVYFKMLNYLGVGGTETNLILIYFVLSQYVGKYLFHLSRPKLTYLSVVGFFVFSSIYVIIMNFNTNESIILISGLGLFFLFINLLFSLVGLKIEW